MEEQLKEILERLDNIEERLDDLEEKLREVKRIAEGALELASMM